MALRPNTTRRRALALRPIRAPITLYIYFIYIFHIPSPRPLHARFTSTDQPVIHTRRALFFHKMQRPLSARTLCNAQGKRDFVAPAHRSGHKRRPPHAAPCKDAVSPQAIGGCDARIERRDANAARSEKRGSVPRIEAKEHVHNVPFAEKRPPCNPLA